MSNSNYDRAIAVYRDLEKTNKAFFMGPFVILFLGRGPKSKPTTKLELHPQSTGLSLAYIENLRKSGGYGKKGMHLICTLADLNQCPITLEIDNSFGRSTKQLKSFYEEFGFKFKGNNGIRKVG